MKLLQNKEPPTLKLKNGAELPVHAIRGSGKTNLIALFLHQWVKENSPTKHKEPPHNHSIHSPPQESEHPQTHEG